MMTQNDLSMSALWQKREQKFLAELQASGVTDAGEIVRRRATEFDAFRERVRDKKRQQALAMAYSKGMKDKVGIEGEGKDARFIAVDPNIEDWADTWSNQFVEGRKQVDWDTFSKNDRGAAVVMAEEALGKGFLSLEGFASEGMRSAAGFFIDVADTVGMSGGIDRTPEEMERQREWMSDVVRNISKSRIRAVTNFVLDPAGEDGGIEEYVGENPEMPETKAERVGAAGSPQAAAAGGLFGEAVGTAVPSVPLMLIPSHVGRAVATVPYFLMGKYGTQEELYEAHLEARELSKRLGIPYDAPTPNDRRIAGYIGGMAEYGSEYVFDTAQMGFLGISKKLPFGKTVQRVFDELGDSLNRHQGIAGVVKRAAQVAGVGLAEGVEETIPQAAKETMGFATPAGFDSDFFSEETFEAGKMGTLSGFLLGGGSAGISAANEARLNRQVRRALEQGGQASMTRSIEERGDEEAKLRFLRNVPNVRGTLMARHAIDQMRRGNRIAMFIDPRDGQSTITPDVRREMQQSGIVKVGSFQGRHVYAYAAFQDDVRQAIDNRDAASLNAFANLNDGELIEGAVTLRNGAGQIVEVIPYSDADELRTRIPAIVASAQANNLTVQNHEPGELGHIADQIDRQVDADAAMRGIARVEYREPRAGDVRKGITQLRKDIKQQVNRRQGVGTDPAVLTQLTPEEIGDATNDDVTVAVRLGRVRDDALSDGEREVSTKMAGRAVVVDGAVVYTIRNTDGTTRTIEKPIPHDGAYLSQSSPDGVFLIRENGDAVTATSAFVTSLHELRHKAVAQSRGGAQHLARLLSIDPVFAARGGAAYMRQIDPRVSGMTDAQIVRFYQAQAQAARETLARPAATNAERAEAQGQQRMAQKFAEESATNVANQALGTATSQAVDWDAIYSRTQERSLRAFSAWMANVLVRNGFFGPHARQALYDVRQRLDNVRGEEFRIHDAFRKRVEESYRGASTEGRRMAQQAEQRGAQPSATGTGPMGGTGAAAPAIAPVGAAAAAAALGGGEEEEKAEPTPTAEDGTILGSVARAVPTLALLAASAMAQVTSGRMTGTTSSRGPKVPPPLRQDGQAAPITAPAVVPTTTPEQLTARMRVNEEQARRIREGMRPTAEVDVGSVARALRAGRYETPREEAVFSVRGRPGRQEANEAVRALRTRYMEERGIVPEADVTDTYAEVDEDFAYRLADWYENAKVDYADPAMLSAYGKFAAETLDQYRFLRDAGIEMVPWAGSGQPYANSAEMTRDLRDNSRLFYFKTINPDEAASFGSDPAKFADQVARNPLLADSGVVVPDSAGVPYRQTYNDLFRAVHDVFGHAAEGFQFGMRGEENAYRSHAVMFSPEARGAMATETRTQNSWVNAGPNRRDESGRVFGPDDPRYSAWLENLKQGNGYADQKPVVTPPEFQALYSMRRKRRPVARGNQALVNRINQEVSRGRMQQEDADFGIELIRRIDQNVPMALSFIGPKAMEEGAGSKYAGAFFDAMEERIAIGTTAIKQGDFREAFTHELWHSLSRFVPDPILKRIGRDYRRALARFRKRTGLDPRKFKSARVIDKATGKTERDAFVEETTRRGIPASEWYRLTDMDEWLVVNAAEATETRMDMEKEVRDEAGPWRAYAMLRLLMRDVASSVKDAFGYGTYDTLAKEFLRGTTLGSASQPGVAWDSTEARWVDMMDRLTDRLEAQEAERIGESQRIREEAAPSAMTPMEAQFSMRPTEEETAAREAAQVASAERRARAVPQRRTGTKSTMAVGMAPSKSLLAYMSRDSAGRAIDPSFAQDRMARAMTSPAMKASMMSAVAKFAPNARLGDTVDVVRGSWEGAKETSIRLTLNGAGKSEITTIARVVGSAFMQDAVLTVMPVGSGLPTRMVATVRPARDSGISAAEIIDAMTSVFGGGSMNADGTVGFVAQTEDIDRETFRDKVAALASDARMEVTVANAGVEFTKTGEYADARPATGKGTRSPVFGRSGTGAARDLWVDLAAGFAHAANLEGFRVDYAKWLQYVEPNDAARSDLAERLFRRVAELDAGGAYGVDSRYLKRYDGDVKGLIYGDKPLVAQTIRDYGDAYRVIDRLLERHPDAFRTEEGTDRFHVELFQSREIPIAPLDHIRRIADGHRADRERFRLITDAEASAGKVGITRGQLDDAVHGMENAEALRRLYVDGTMKPKHTVLLFMWGFMSRGVSPNVQESMLLDLINYRYDGSTLWYYDFGTGEPRLETPEFIRASEAASPAGSNFRLVNKSMSVPISGPLDIDYFVTKAVDGTFDATTEREWIAFVTAAMDSISTPQVDMSGKPLIVNGEPVLKSGSFGAGAVHNANAFGRTFLRKIANRVSIDGVEKSGLQHIHDALSNPASTADDVRRLFQRLGGGLGIDNKVVSFNSLVAGRFGIVADRVFLRLAYNADNRLGVNVYDGGIMGWNVNVGGKTAVFVRNVEEAGNPQDAIIDVLRSHVRAAVPRNNRQRKALSSIVNSAPLTQSERADRSRKRDDEQKALLDALSGTGMNVTVEPVEVGGVNGLWEGVRGIAFYKAFERSVRLDQAFSDLIKQHPPFARHAHFGMYHWLPWVIDSKQEASHKTVEAIMEMAKRDSKQVTGVYAKEGKYNAFQYGGEYGYEQVVGKDGRTVVEPRYRQTLPDGKMRQYTPTAWKKFIEVVKDPASNVVPRGFRISEQTAPWYLSPQLTQQNRENLYRIADAMETSFSVTGWLDRKRSIAAMSSEDERTQAVSYRVDDLSREEIRRMYVETVVPYPKEPRFQSWNRDNRLTGIVPNDIWFHGTMKGQFRRYGGKPGQLGWHLGSFAQAQEFLKGRKQQFIMPVYAVGRNPLRLPDMGHWTADAILDGMLRLKVAEVGDIEEIRSRMRRETKQERNDLPQKLSDGGVVVDAFGEAFTVTEIIERNWITRELDRLGYDSIIYQNTYEPRELPKKDPALAQQLYNLGRDSSEVHAAMYGRNDSIILWNYGQVKSINATDYDVNNEDISYSIRTEAGSRSHSDPSIVVEDASFSMRRGLRGVKDQGLLAFVDRYDELQRLHREAGRAGMALPDPMNPYLGLRTLTGRLGAAQQMAERRYSEILRDMHENGISMDEMDDFLTAQHALNGGNDYIATINPAFPDGGTGMLNRDARDVIARANASGRFGTMNRIAEDWREMLRDQLRQRRDSGLITDDTYNAITSRYTHYVPLRGAPARPEDEVFEQFDEEAMEGMGGGASTTGRGMQRRLGRASRAEAVTSQVAFVHEDGLRRIARNEIGNRFRRLVTTLNDPEEAIVVRPTRRYLDNAGTMRVGYDPAWMNNDRMFGLYVDEPTTVNGHRYQRGDLMVIRITNPRLAYALKNPTIDLNVFDRVMRSATNAFRFVTTGMGNPAFAPVNMLRDVATGSLNNYVQRGIADTARMLSRWPGSFARVFADSWRGTPTGTYAEMQRAGGDMMAWRPNDLELKRMDFDRLYRDAQSRRPGDPSVVRRLMGWYPAFFSAAETATRLARYQQSIATGHSREQSALHARDVTVDFAKGGRVKNLLNTWYPFVNAGIQGTAVMAGAIRRNPGRAAAVTGAIFTLGLVNAALARMLAGEDEESGMNRWDMVPEYEKATNLFFFDPRGSGRYVKVPMPYGYNVVVGLGRRVADATWGNLSPSKVVGGTVVDGLNAFNPMGGSGITSGEATAFTSLLPLVLRPAGEIATNQNFAGSPIYRESFSRVPEVDAYNYFDGTGAGYVSFAGWLNDMTGGDRFEPGMVSLSPNTMEYLVGYYLSGAGRMMNQIGRLAEGEVEARNVPIASRFVGEAGSNTRALSELYYGEERDTTPAVRRAEASMDKSLPIEVREQAKRDVNADDLRVALAIKQTEKGLREVREAMKTATPEQRKRLMEVRARLMKRALRVRTDLTRANQPVG